MLKEAGGFHTNCSLHVCKSYNLQMIYAYMGWKRISKFQTFTVKVVHLLSFCKRNQKHPSESEIF